jgi:hypothetical protein
MMIYEKRIESSMTKIMNELKKYQIMRQVEQQYVEQQFEPDRAIPKARDFEAATQDRDKQSDLKKQSQFVPGQNVATSCLKVDYENKQAIGADENKAKQTQFQAIASDEVKGEREKSISVTTG